MCPLTSTLLMGMGKLPPFLFLSSSNTIWSVIIRLMICFLFRPLNMLQEGSQVQKANPIHALLLEEHYVISVVAYTYGWMDVPSSFQTFIIY